MKLSVKILLVIAGVLYIASLFFPAFLARGASDAVTQGWFALLFGFFAVFGLGVGWAANPLALTAVIFIGVGFPRLALVLAVLAFLVSFLSLIAQNTNVFPFDAGVWLGLVGPGFYLWTASLGLIVVAATINALKWK